MSEPIPSDRTRSRQLVLASAVVAIVLLIAAAVLWAVMRPDAPASKPPIRPAEETSASVTATSSSEPTSASPTSSSEPSASNAPTEPAKPPVFRRVAFRLGSTLYVADEDGTDPRPAARVPAGPYALSPDGATLAYVYQDKLSLVDIATGAVADVGPAEMGFRPVWSADSRRVAYRAWNPDGDAFILWESRVDGSSARRLGEGDIAAYSPTGDLLAIALHADGQRTRVVVLRGQKVLRRVDVDREIPTSIALTDKRLYLGQSDGMQATSIDAYELKTGKRHQLLEGPPIEAPAVWGALFPARDGKRLAVQALGDDGFARAWVVDATSAEVTDVTKRRDGQINSWSRDGRQLFVIEGNAVQGEPTALVSMKPDGTDRHDIVTGAQ